MIQKGNIQYVFIFAQDAANHNSLANRIFFLGSLRSAEASAHSCFFFFVDPYYDVPA